MNKKHLFSYYKRVSNKYYIAVGSHLDDGVVFFFTAYQPFAGYSKPENI